MPPTLPSQFINSTPLLGDGAALRDRAQSEGYLFFKGLLPPDAVLQVRANLLNVIERYGWRDARQGSLDGGVDVAALNQVPEDEMRLDIGVSHAAYDDVQKLESVHRLPHHPHLLDVYRTLFDGEVLVHPRHIVRLVTPHHAMVPTPQHQDFPLIQGTPTTWTCWFPVGDCPRELGGLTVLRASHQLGNLPTVQSPGAGGIASQLCPWETDWVQGDYQIGDVLTFPSMTVHKALPCQRRDQIRLSFDVRYQPADEPIELRSLNPHCGLTWDEIYQGWQNHDLQRYWESLPLNMAAWDDKLKQPARRIC